MTLVPLSVVLRAMKIASGVSMGTKIGEWVVTNTWFPLAVMRFKMEAKYRAFCG